MDKQIIIEKDIYTLTKADLVVQLISKTQECEKWKNQVLILDDENVTIQVTQEQFEEYQQLKQECEKLNKGAIINLIIIHLVLGRHNG